MASPNIYSAGLNLAGTVFANGPTTLQLGGAVYLSGVVQWLDTIGGNDSNAGTLPELPVKTLAQALTNSAANGVIVIGAGSSETLGSAQALSLAGLSVFGCGTGSSRPRYTSNGAGMSLFNITGAGTWVENIYFPASTAAGLIDRVEIGAASCTAKDCYFECGVNDTVRALRVSSSNATVDGCYFVATASRPAVGLEVSGAVSDTLIRNCTFNGGSYGWSNYSLNVAGAVTRAKVVGGSFINRSDIGFTVTGASYQLYGVSPGGTANVLLTA